MGSAGFCPSAVLLHPKGLKFALRSGSKSSIGVLGPRSFTVNGSWHLKLVEYLDPLVTTKYD